MNITLDPEVERFIEQQVNAGIYPSASEMVTDALLLLRTADAERIPSDELRRLIAEGQAEADRGEFVDGESVFAELRELNQRAGAGQ